MNKRIFGLILALAMLGSVLTGCGNKNNTSAKLENGDEYPADKYEIQWYLPIEETPADLASVETE